MRNRIAGALFIGGINIQTDAPGRRVDIKGALGRNLDHLCNGNAQNPLQQQPEDLHVLHNLSKEKIILKIQRHELPVQQDAAGFLVHFVCRKRYLQAPWGAECRPAGQTSTAFD